jgi:3',5'-nucleoside bisphosphate phosphatase
VKYADLHIHTYYSDSTFSPEEVVDCADKKGLSAIAICDHDCVDGIGPCRGLAQPLGIEVVPGIEMTVEKKDAEIHILGYYIDWKDDEFRKKLKTLRDARIERVHKIIKKLKEHGITIDAEDVFRLAARGTVGRLHIAQVILKAGQAKSFREIFEKYIGFMKPCYVSNLRFTPKEAIGEILKIGGVPVLAHPYTMGKDEYIPELVKCGLRGIEVFHTDHKAAAEKHYSKIAEEYGLIVTGGSDCHGIGKGRVLIGTVRVPYDIVERLKEESRKISHEHR